VCLQCEPEPPLQYCTTGGHVVCSRCYGDAATGAKCHLCLADAEDATDEVGDEDDDEDEEEEGEE
jgi:hypothetical protein